MTPVIANPAIILPFVLPKDLTYSGGEDVVRAVLNLKKEANNFYMSVS